MKTELTEFQPVTTMLAQFEPYRELTIAGVDDKDGFERVHQARMEVKQARVSLEKSRKALKAEALEFGRRVDAEAKRIAGMIAPIENHLQSQEEAFLAEKARIIREREEQKAKQLSDRLEQLMMVNAVVNPAIVGAMSESEFEQLIAEKTAEHNAAMERIRIEQEERKKEEARLAAERAEIERLRQEQARKEGEARLAAERAEQARKEEEARLAAERAEIERVRKEQARKEQELIERAEEERKRAEKEAAERAEAARKQEEALIAAENARRAEEQRILDEERRRIEAEAAKVRAEKERLERDEQKRLEDEEREKSARKQAEAAAASRTDWERIADYCAELRAVTLPNFQSNAVRVSTYPFISEIFDSIDQLEKMARSV